MPNYSQSTKLSLASTEEPPYLTIGTDVSAKYKGAFCEAKITDVSKHVKLRVLFEGGSGTHLIDDTDLKAGSLLETGTRIEARHPEKKQQTYVQATVTKILDHSRYTVVFDDGDQCILRRNSLCLKSGKHFAESETLDQLPLTNPEHFGNPVKVGAMEQLNSSSVVQVNNKVQNVHPLMNGKPKSKASTNSSSTTSDEARSNGETNSSRKRQQQQDSNKDNIKKLKKERNSTSATTAAPSSSTTITNNTTTVITSANLTPFVGRGRGATKGRKRRDSINNGANKQSAELDDDSADSMPDSIGTDTGESNVKFEQIELGVKLMVQYGKGKVQNVYEAKVNKIETNSAGKTRYFVHYTGWNNRYDEWIYRNRIVAIVSDRENGSRDGRTKHIDSGPLANQTFATTTTPPVTSNSSITPLKDLDKDKEREKDKEKDRKEEKEEEKDKDTTKERELPAKTRRSRQAAELLSTTSTGTCQDTPVVSTTNCSTNLVSSLSSSVTNPITTTATSKASSNTNTHTPTTTTTTTAPTTAITTAALAVSATATSSSLSATPAATTTSSTVASTPLTKDKEKDREKEKDKEREKERGEKDKDHNKERELPTKTRRGRQAAELSNSMPATCLDIPVVPSANISTNVISTSSNSLTNSLTITTANCPPNAVSQTHTPITAPTVTPVTSTPATKEKDKERDRDKEKDKDREKERDKDNNNRERDVPPTKTRRSRQVAELSTNTLATATSLNTVASPLSTTSSTNLSSSSSKSMTTNSLTTTLPKVSSNASTHTPIAVAAVTATTSITTTSTSVTTKDKDKHLASPSVAVVASIPVKTETTNVASSLATTVGITLASTTVTSSATTSATASTLNISNNSAPSSTPSTTITTSNATSTTNITNSSRPIYKFCEEIYESDCDKKISLLQERMMALRQTYISLKTELADLDRRRKRPRSERTNAEHINCSLMCRN